MACAINIRSDNDTADQIRSLWGDASLLEQLPSMDSLNYPPHLTLAVYDELDSSLAVEAVKEIFTGFKTQTIRFERLGMFEATHALILWAAPSISSEMIHAHGQIHKIIDANLCRPNYRPGAWVPHCSLATSVPTTRKEEAVAFANRTTKMDVVFDVVDCALFKPVKVVHEVVLAPAT